MGEAVLQERLAGEQYGHSSIKSISRCDAFVGRGKANANPLCCEIGFLLNSYLRRAVATSLEPDQNNGPGTQGIQIIC